MAESKQEVSLAGRLVGLSILGSTVIFVIALESMEREDLMPYVKFMLLGALVLAIAVPLLFFRRPMNNG
jgi:hypothetical protein